MGCSFPPAWDPLTLSSSPLHKTASYSPGAEGGGDSVQGRFWDLLVNWNGVLISATPWEQFWASRIVEAASY